MTGIPIPTLGYRSRTQAVLALLNSGLTPPQVAIELGISRRHLSGYVTAAGNPLRGRPGRWRRQGPGRNIWIPQAVTKALEPIAKRRGVYVTTIVREILCVAVEENLLSAILDDDGIGGQP